MAMTVNELGRRIGARVQGDGSLEVTECAGLDDAQPHHVSFLANRKYTKLLDDTRAGVVVVGPEDAKLAPQRTLLIADDPYFAFRQAVVALHGFRPQPEPGVSKLAVIDPQASIGQECSIQPFVCIESGARVGRGCVIYPHCYIGKEAVLGDHCVLYPNVVIYNHCHLGNRVTLHAGCVIGQDGFGYATHQGVHHKIPQVGNVIIEDDVELGANCAVDRATVGSTRIGQGTKMSDLVAIGHGTNVGKHNLIVAQVGLAGSVQTGDYVAMGGQVGVAGHLNIGDMAQVAAKAGVMTDVPAREQYGGMPAIPLQQAKRNVLALTKLPAMMQDFRKLKKRVAELEALLKSKR